MERRLCISDFNKSMEGKQTQTENINIHSLENIHTQINVIQA